jgi:hypothetical protein
MGKMQALIVIAFLGWPLFKVSFYLATRYQVDAPLDSFDLLVLLAWIALSFCIWVVYSRFVRPTAHGTRKPPGEA